MAAPAHSHQHWTLIITGDRVCCIKSSEIKSQWNPFTMTFSSDQGSLDSHCPRGTKVAVTTKHSLHPQKQTLLVPAGQVGVLLDAQVTSCSLFAGLKAVIANSLTSSETLCFRKCCKVAL